MAVVAHVILRGLSPEQYDAVRAATGRVENPPEGAYSHLAWWEGEDKSQRGCLGERSRLRGLRPGPARSGYGKARDQRRSRGDVPSRPRGLHSAVRHPDLTTEPDRPPLRPAGHLAGRDAVDSCQRLSGGSDKTPSRQSTGVRLTKGQDHVEETRLGSDRSGCGSRARSLWQ